MAAPFFMLWRRNHVGSKSNDLYRILGRYDNFNVRYRGYRCNNKRQEA